MTNIPRNHNALRARQRNGGPMKHRNTPRGGAHNDQADLLAEVEDEHEPEPANGKHVPLPEPIKGEHVGAFIVNNPLWPSGEGPYLVPCPGCDVCEV